MQSERNIKRFGAPDRDALVSEGTEALYRAYKKLLQGKVELSETTTYPRQAIWNSLITEAKHQHRRGLKGAPGPVSTLSLDRINTALETNDAADLGAAEYASLRQLQRQETQYVSGSSGDEGVGYSPEVRAALKRATDRYPQLLDAHRTIVPHEADVAAIWECAQEAMRDTVVLKRQLLQQGATSARGPDPYARPKPSLSRQIVKPPQEQEEPSEPT